MSGPPPLPPTRLPPPPPLRPDRDEPPAQAAELILGRGRGADDAGATERLDSVAAQLDRLVAAINQMAGVLAAGRSPPTPAAPLAPEPSPPSPPPAPPEAGGSPSPPPQPPPPPPPPPQPFPGPPAGSAASPPAGAPPQPPTVYEYPRAPSGRQRWRAATNLMRSASGLVPFAGDAAIGMQRLLGVYDAWKRFQKAMAPPKLPPPPPVRRRRAPSPSSPLGTTPPPAPAVPPSPTPPVDVGAAPPPPGVVTVGGATIAGVGPTAGMAPPPVEIAGAGGAEWPLPWAMPAQQPALPAPAPTPEAVPGQPPAPAAGPAPPRAAGPGANVNAQWEKMSSVLAGRGLLTPKQAGQDQGRVVSALKGAADPKARAKVKRHYVRDVLADVFNKRAWKLAGTSTDAGVPVAGGGPVGPGTTTGGQLRDTDLAELQREMVDLLKEILSELQDDETPTNQERRGENQRAAPGKTGGTQAASPSATPPAGQGGVHPNEIAMAFSHNGAAANTGSAFGLGRAAAIEEVGPALAAGS